MVCPACLTAVVLSQLPTIAAAVGAAGIKMAYDQRLSPKARAVEQAQPRRFPKVGTNFPYVSRRKDPISVTVHPFAAPSI